MWIEEFTGMETERASKTRLHSTRQWERAVGCTDEERAVLRNRLWTSGYVTETSITIVPLVLTPT
jgi:hypothetical protein